MRGLAGLYRRRKNEISLGFTQVHSAVPIVMTLDFAMTIC